MSDNWEGTSSALRLVAFVTDVGGPVALHDILSELPANFSAPILVMQSANDILLESASAALRHTIRLKISPMRHAGRLHAGAVYFAEDGKSYRPVESGSEIRIEMHGGDAEQNGLAETMAGFARVLGSSLTVAFLSGRSSSAEIARLCSILESNECPILVLDREESVVDELGLCVLGAAATATEMSAVAMGDYLQARAIQIIPVRKTKIRAGKR